MTSGGRTVALLLSRQAGRPSRNHAWVAKASEAVAWVKQNDLVLCSSTGMNTWELVTALGSINKIHLKIILPVQAGQEFQAARETAIQQFDLDPTLVNFHHLPQTGQITNHSDLMQHRDRCVVDMADLILPLSIRPRGNMSDLLTEASNRGTEIDERFLTAYPNRPEPYAYRINPENLNPVIDHLNCEYLTHWTRAVSGKCPDEKLIDFYRAVVLSDEYPRGGCDTLRRIMETGKILASAKNMPGKVATVSFSGANPRQLVPLIKWRARYHQMSFEPYGIGISKQLAENLQIKQVNYYRQKSDPEALSVPSWLTQSIGKITDWRPEQEYRHRGDLYLKDIPRDQMILFCRFATEAKKLENTFGIRTVPFETKRK